jgi:RHS repeat-associated protein
VEAGCPPAGEVLFAGQARDVELAQDYLNARQLSFARGRFVTPDPMGVPTRIANPQAFNRYTYALNNPLGYTDPTGLEAEKEFLSAPVQDGDGIQFSETFSLNPLDKFTLFEQQMLFVLLWNNYPVKETYPTISSPGLKTIWDVIGGQVATIDSKDPKHPTNSCAIRLSYAINHSGVNIAKTRMTLSGSDGRNYYANLDDLVQFLTNTFGRPSQYTQTQFVERTGGNQGVVVFFAHWTNATGHATLWNGKGFVDGQFSQRFLTDLAVYNISFWSIK